VFGNGDILSYEDYEQALINSPSAAGIMISRGALIKPWIFTEVKEQRHWDISSSDRLDILKRYVNYGLEHWGSDTKVTETLHHLHLNWNLILILICFLIRCADHATPLYSQKLARNFVNKWRSISRYSSFAD
jgi:tRNA-dihydrouridine synthase